VTTQPPKPKFVYCPPTPDDFRRRLAHGTPEDNWRAIEDEYGTLDWTADAVLKHIMKTELRIAEILAKIDRDPKPKCLSVPPVVAIRILSDVLDKLKLRRSALTADDKQAINAAKVELRRALATLPRRSKHRPRKDWLAQRNEIEAVQEFDQLFRRLMKKARGRDEAIAQAAGEVAPCWGIKPATLISWWAHPGRRAWTIRQRTLASRRRK
jgi:hypothetical protein